MLSQSLVLCSAGLDSTVLVVREAQDRIVQPVYVSVGLAWEAAERAALARLLDRLPLRERIRPPAILTVDMRDVYPETHWAIRGEPPGYDTPDEDVYLEGRNVVLLAKAAVYAARAGIARIALGPLACNPFPDATPRFFASMAEALSLGLDRALEIATPFTAMHKAEVIALGRSLGVPLELTLSCMHPRDGVHCGRCSKCRERHDGFKEAGLDDPTRYDRVIG
jgi:7-cyano-7-deazaguanine synthase